MLKEDLMHWNGFDPEAPVAEVPHAAKAQDAESEPDGEFVFDDLAYMSQDPSPLMRFLTNPRLVGALAVSVCLAATVTYTAIGLVLSSDHPAQPAQTQLASAHQPVKQSIHRRANVSINTAQSQSSVQNDNPMDEAFGLLGMETAGGKDPLEKETTAGPEIPGLTVPEVPGRDDPFGPLVTPGGSSVGPAIPEGPVLPKDVLESLQYTGYIGEINSKDKVAVIRISDSIQGDYTVIKKAGESFMVDGQFVTLKSISRDALQLKVEGKTRRLDLNPYVEIAASGTSGGGGFGSGASAPGGGAGAGAGAAGGGAALPPGLTGDPANPSLAEPTN